MSVNKIFLLGRLGSAPSVRQAGERKVCSFRVATEEKWATGTQTEWHTVEAWGALGERCAQYLVQGQRVHVEGKLASDEWERNGSKVRTWKVVARDVRFLDRPGGGQHERG